MRDPEMSGCWGCLILIIIILGLWGALTRTWPF